MRKNAQVFSARCTDTEKISSDFINQTIFFHLPILHQLQVDDQQWELNLTWGRGIWDIYPEEIREFQVSTCYEYISKS